MFQLNPLETIVQAPKTAVYIRWMERRDMDAVLRIEQEGFDDPWDENEFLKCLRSRTVVGMVAVFESEVVGFYLYEILKTSFSVVNLAVALPYRRQNVGGQMIRKLLFKLNPERRSAVDLQIHDANLTGQLFFASQGFRATEVLRDFFGDSDAYVMKYKACSSVPTDL